jgi:hypothetical protein
MGTVTIASTRGLGLTDLVLFGVSIAVLALITYTVVSRMKMYRRQ